MNSVLSTLKKIRSKNVALALGLVFASMQLSGCFVGVSSYPYYSGSYYPYYDPYYDPWGGVYGGGYCDYYNPGCYYYPFAPTTSGNTLGLNSADGRVEMQYQQWSYRDAWGNAKTYTGFGWLSPEGSLLNSYGIAMNDAESTEATPDLIAQVSAQENQTAQAAGTRFAQEYGLASEAGIRVAKTLQDWALLAKDRARTVQDIEDVSVRLYGLKPEKTARAINQAIQTKSMDSLNELAIDVAAYWGTTPGTSSVIMKKWYKSELNRLGIK